MSKNRHGTVYPYFVCLGRHQKTTNCTQRAMLISIVEERIEELYLGQQLDTMMKDQIHAILREDLSSLRRNAEIENRRLTTHKERLINEWARLLQAHYVSAVPLDLLKTEKDRISRQLADVELSLTATSVEFDRIEECLGKALDYAVHCGRAYLRAGPQERRLLNQAFFERIDVYEDDVQVGLAEPFKTLLSEELADTAQQHVATSHQSRRLQRGNALSLTEVLQSTNDKPAHLARVERDKFGGAKGIRTPPLTRENTG